MGQHSPATSIGLVAVMMVLEGRLLEVIGYIVAIAVEARDGGR